MALSMAVLGVATLLAAVAEAWRKAPAPHWVPHLAMGAVMIGMHVWDPYLLWTGGAVLAAAAAWTGMRNGGSENLRADSADLTTCAVLLCASAGRQGTDGPSMSLEANHIGHHSGSGTTLYAAASLIALVTTLTWSVARSVIHVRASRGTAHRPAAVRARTRRGTTFVVQTTGLVMVPLMAGTVIWG
ncbi:hypothetical protein [Streptomyces mirabilis]|uniref:hypothetical protein n=1 Tax=Streptomyces mirabilis TaxID=68239 RepID=UPI003652334D